MKVLKTILCELMIGYGQFLFSLVGQAVTPFLFAVLIIVLSLEVEENNVWGTRFVALLIFSALLYFHYACVNLWLTSKKKKKKNKKD